jgi:hypothetical protein
MQLTSSATILLGLALCVPIGAQDKPKLAQLNTFADMISVDGFWEPGPAARNRPAHGMRRHGQQHPKRATHGFVETEKGVRSKARE